MVWQKGHKLQGGRYVIEKIMGEGGFGITYKAKHTLLNQWLVIKTPNESLKNDSEYPNYVKRFIQEGQKLAALSQQPHPNIVRVTELFQESETYCLVMDFVPGESLFNLVQERGALPELEAVGYVQQIGEALIFVHHQGLVHRDAHPGNIMVQKNGKAVLIDFGIAGEIMPQDGYFTSHHPANIVFAPYEQMGGNRQVTIDVYTLAASLYYAVTGKRPESSLDRKLYNKPLIPPNKYVVGISNNLNVAILKGMNLEAENRPKSMREWLKLLPNFSNQIYQVNNKIEHQTIKTDKTFPVIVSHNNSLNIRVNSKDIPYTWSRFIVFYLIMGFIISGRSDGGLSPLSLFCCACFSNLILALTNALPLPLLFALTFPITCLLLVVFNLIPLTLALVVFCFLYSLLLVAYSGVYKNLSKYSSKDYKFLILLSASSIGIFLGWLVYQFFPVFAHR